MKLLKLLPILFISSCISSPRIPPAPLVDFCKVTIRNQLYVCRCVTPDQELYSVSIEKCVGYDAVSKEHGAALRDYVVLLQTQLDECKRQTGDGTFSQ